MSTQPKKRNFKRDLRLTVFIAMSVFVFGGGVLYLRAVSNRGSEPYIQIKMDEGYGVKAYDSMGANDATVTNALWKSEDECKTGKCLYLDGTGDYASIPDFALD